MMALGLQVGDVRSDHNYPNAISSGATADRASICSEFGGLGLFIQVCKTCHGMRTQRAMQEHLRLVESPRVQSQKL